MMMEPGEKKAEPMSMKRIAGTCEHVGVYEAKNVAIYPEGVLVSGILGRLQIVINQFDEPMFIFDPYDNTPAPSANTPYNALLSSFKTYWKGKKDSPQVETIDSPGTKKRRASLPGPSDDLGRKIPDRDSRRSARRDITESGKAGRKEKTEGSPSRSLSPPPDLSRSKSKSPEAQGLIVKSYSISLKVSDIFSVNEQSGAPICRSKLVMAQCEGEALPDFYFLEGDISKFFQKLSIFIILRPSEHNSNFYFSLKPVAPSPSLPSSEINQTGTVKEEQEEGQGEEGEKFEEVDGFLLCPTEEGEEDKEKEDNSDESDFEEPAQKADGGFSSLMRCMTQNVAESNRERSERNGSERAVSRRGSFFSYGEDIIPVTPPSSSPPSPTTPSSPLPSPPSPSTPPFSSPSTPPPSSPSTPPFSQLPGRPFSSAPRKPRLRKQGSASLPSLSSPPSPLPPALSDAVTAADQQQRPSSPPPTRSSRYSSFFSLSMRGPSPIPSTSVSDPKPPSLRESLKGEELIDSFHMIKKKKEKESPVNRIRVRRLDELGAEEWNSFFDEDGKLRTCQQYVLSRIFSGGLVHEIRHIVWKFLLGFFPWDSTKKEREEIQIQKQKDYEVYKGQWTSITRRQLQRFQKFREILSRVKKDVVRTDRTNPFYAGDHNPNLRVLNDVLVTYCLFNFDLGYCQGMNDLLSPIIYVMEGREADSFWCFKGYMDIAQRNFEKSQKFIQDQLLELNVLLAHVDPVLSKHLFALGAESMIFCFRWLLCRFKREFGFFDTMRLWEVMWTNALTPNFHLFVALAVLLNIRNPILTQASRFDEILKICNDVAGTQEVEEILVMAEFIFEYWSIQVGNPRLH